MFVVDGLSEHYHPRPASLFQPSRIVLAKGSNYTEARRRLAERICAAYPEAIVVEAFSTPHNRVDLGETDPLRLHERGKKTLVLSEHLSAVRFSDEGDNACPNYWHFSPYGFCPYGCRYCYLAGTSGVWFSPTVKIFLNLEEILAQVDRTANQLARPKAFYLGKLQDGLALDPLSGYARTMIPFFARHPYAHMVILTKSADIDNLLNLDHAGRTILSWTVNAPEIVRDFERNSPDVMDRIEAMRRCAQIGYPVRAVVMPIIPIADWQEVYGRFMASLIASVPLSRITLGSICSYPQAQHLMELKLGKKNVISSQFDRGPNKLEDGRLRFSRSTRTEVYRCLIECIRRIRPDLEIGLCLEDEEMFASLGLQKSIGRCNCML
ncbi:MAG: radical SAM protein [Thermoguttaceae bacterium]|jgi:DNA repair photolyase